jgi:hypothetical protein
MKTLKFFISLAFFALIYQIECHAINKTISQPTRDDKISFIESNSENDESEKVREKIRKEMDEYRKQKENKKKKVASIITTTSTTTTTTTTTQAPPSSSTLVHVHLIGIDEEPTDDDLTTENYLETSTFNDTDTTTDVIDRFIIDAPNLCKNGEQYAAGRCRKIYK